MFLTTLLYVLPCIGGEQERHKAMLDLCNTRESRAATYKLTYNSVLGKNSTERYIADAERYLDDK